GARRRRLRRVGEHAPPQARDARALPRLPRTRLARARARVRAALRPRRIPEPRGGRAGPPPRSGARQRHRSRRPTTRPARAAPRARAARAPLRLEGFSSVCAYTPPVQQEITALIVDDHEVVREGLRLTLSRAPHIRIVGEASD